MAMDSTANLLFTIGADSSDAQSNIQRFRTVLSKDLGQIAGEFEGWATKVFGSLATPQGIATAGVAALASAMVAGAAAAKAAAERYIEYAGEVGRAARITGMSAEDVSKLRYAARASNTDFETLTTGLVRFSSTVLKANEGSQAQAQAFQRLGVSRAQLAAGERNLLPLLEQVMDRFAGLKNGVEKTAIARELFSRGGEGLINFLNMGAAGFRELAAQAERFGVILTSKDLTAVKEIKAELNALKTQQEALDLVIGRETIPVLAQLTAMWGALKVAMIKPKFDSAWDWVPVIGFLKRWGEQAGEMLVQARKVAAITSAKGTGTLAPGDTGGKALQEQYTGLSTLLESVRQKAQGVGSEEARVASEATHMIVEFRKALEELDKAQAKGLDPKQYAAEAAAALRIPAMIAQWATGELNKLADRRNEAILAARRDLEQQLIGLQTQTYTRQHFLWDREIDDREATLAKEKKLDADATKTLAEIRSAGHARIAREQNEAYRGELVALQQALAQMVEARMTAAERIGFLYDQQMEQYSQVREAEALAKAGTPGERAALEAQFALNRQAALDQYGASVMRLYNSQGWQGVFGNFFAQGIRENEALLREWAESADQAMLMVRVAGETLGESSRKWFGQFAQGMGQSIAQAIVYKKSVGEAMREALAATLASIAAESFVMAIYSTALGFIRLAQHQYQAAGEAFTAAGIFGTVGAAAAVAGRAIAPAQGAQAGAESTGAGAASAAGAEGSTGTESAGTTVHLHVYGNVIGPGAGELIAQILNEAVVDRDVRLISTQTRQDARAVR